MANAVSSNTVVRLVVELACIVDNSRIFHTQYIFSHLRNRLSASYARRSDNPQQYAEQRLARSVWVVVSLELAVFHLPKGLACELPSFLDSSVLTCDITGENQTTGPGRFWFLARGSSNLPVVGQSGLTPLSAGHIPHYGRQPVVPAGSGG
jgi:hypothetical protein